MFTLTFRACLGKTTSLALYVLSLWTLAWRLSKERFLRRWSTAMPIVGASFLGIAAAWNALGVLHSAKKRTNIYYIAQMKEKQKKKEKVKTTELISWELHSLLQSSCRLRCPIKHKGLVTISLSSRETNVALPSGNAIVQIIYITTLNHLNEHTLKKWK